MTSSTTPVSVTTPSGFDQADPLSQLRDIHLPDPVSWWPPAPGWWVLGLITLTILFFAIRRLIQYRRNNAYRKEALEQLKLLPSTASSNLEQCQALMTLLRRTAKTAYPQQALASELNSVFLTRLNACCRQPVFDDQLQKQLENLPYQANPEITDSMLQQLRDATTLWLKKHRAGASC